jgi:hypothetical protein
MKKNKFLKIGFIVLISTLVIGGGLIFYVYNAPHRDVQQTKTDYVLTSSQIVNEYLADPLVANNKYLDSEGESKIIEVQGRIYSISDDYNNNKLILLKSNSEKAGVRCTFLPETNKNVSKLLVGNNIIVKGVIRSGASYDSDLEMYENVIMEKCDIVNK